MDSNKAEGLDQPSVSQEKIESLKGMLYPEVLDSSKVLPVFTDSNLNFRVNDLLGVKEVSELAKDKSELVKMLTQISFIKLSDDKESGSVIIDEKLAVFSFLNIPSKLSTDEIVEKLNMKSENVVRLYKKSLFWVLVAIGDSQSLEKNFSQLDLGNGKLKYEVTLKSQIIKNINKQIQTSNYQKESHQLKVDSGSKNETKTNGNHNSSPGNSNNKDRRNSEAFSWRKKSGDGDLNSPEISKNTNFYSNYNSNGSNNKFSQNKNNSFKRERFNSEGNNPSKFSIVQPKYTAEKFEEIEIDVTNLKYSLNIKNKYTLQEMLNHFELLNSNKAFDLKPQFNSVIDEICSIKKKEFHVVAKGRDRANTSYSVNNAFKKGYDSNPNSNEKRLSFHQDNTAGMKIPMNNPLANIGKSFNKFDDPNLSFNPINLAFNSVQLGDNPEINAKK